MKTRSLDVVVGCVLLGLLAGLPLLGVALAGKPIHQYTEFPPTTHYVPHAGFLWPVFIALAVCILIVVLPFLVRIISSLLLSEILSSNSAIENRQSKIVNSFPLWGWFGLAFGVGAWILAWNRFPWFAPFQPFTFSPLWFAYIIVINALTQWRTGQCMMLNRTRYFLCLFPVSAGFWWFFEYLNRFVQNWYYVDVGTLSPLQYFVFATPPFSTVLPAVLGTYELLASFPVTAAGLDRFAVIAPRRPRALAGIVLALACAGLTGIGIWPDYLFPLLWLAPLFIIVSLQALQGRDTILAPIQTGNWQRIFRLALAALICGFFWEMWNFRSLAKWIYAVPFVGNFHIFEMPLLGYAGYLPFGLECAVIGDMVQRLFSSSCASCAFLRQTEDSRKEAQEAQRGKLVGATVCKHADAAILAALALWFFIIPGFLVLHYINDPALKGPGIPKIAWDLHKRLTPRYEKWARARVASGVAAHLQLYDVPSTEWPIFGSVYYLWATENLQAAWEKDHTLSRQAPRDYARATIDAATDLILDPAHHTWVKQHWGKDYLHTENVFFRTLIIAGLTARENLLKDGRHLDLLRDQVETLAADLDASPFGLLNDYPDECYPVDVFAAVACIRRADAVLGTDHRAFVAREIRAFEGRMLDERGLLPYFVDNPFTGKHSKPSRGIGNSYILIFAPELYPEQAKTWYVQYEKHFWQERMFAAGFREYPKDIPNQDWFFDVDSGPVIDGYSPAGNAYAVAATRANGRFDQGYPIAAQVIAATWPRPDGTLLGGRILSDSVHAPHLGEANLLFLLTQQPAPGVEIKTGGHLPGLVYVAFLFFFGIGVATLAAAAYGIRKWRRSAPAAVPAERLQATAWTILILTALALIVIGKTGPGCVALLMGQLLPQARHS